MARVNISKSDSDEAVLKELGERLTQQRIAMRLSQADLAEQAGVGKRTVERIEAGESAQATTLIRLFRVLELLPALDALIPGESASPMALLHHRGKKPRRVRRKGGATREDGEASEWRWGESRADTE